MVPKYKEGDYLYYVGKSSDWLILDPCIRIEEIKTGFSRNYSVGEVNEQTNEPCLWYYVRLGDGGQDHFHHGFMEDLADWRLATKEEALLYGPRNLSTGRRT